MLSTPKGFGRVTARSDDRVRVRLFSSGREADLSRSELSEATTSVDLRTEQRRGWVFFTFRLEAEPRNSTVY